MSTCKIRLRNALLTLILLFPIVLVAQPPTRQLDATFGGIDNETVTSIQQTSDGGYIIGGWTYSDTTGDKTGPTRGSSDYWVVKTNSLGVKQWDASFGTSGIDVLQAVVTTDDGGYLLAGYSHSGLVNVDKSSMGYGNFDFWVIKINNVGVKQWDSSYGGLEAEYLSTVLKTVDGGFILAGSSHSGITGVKTTATRGNYDYWVLKINSTGVVQWDRSYGGLNDDMLTTLIATPDGGLLLGGNSNSSASGDKSQSLFGTGSANDYWCIKTNAIGIKEWDVTLGGNGIEDLKALKQVTGGYLLAGSSASGVTGSKTSSNKGETDYWIVKINLVGVQQWDASYGGSLSEDANSIFELSDGSFLIGGSSSSPIGGDRTHAIAGSDFWLLRINNTGVLQWDQSFGGGLSDVLASMSATSDNAWVMAGTSSSGMSNYKTQESKGGSDYWMIKLNPMQKQNQTITFPVIEPKIFGDAPFNTATASSGLDITYTSSNTSVAVILNGMVNIRGVGTAIITASQPGNDFYNAAQPVSRLLTVERQATTIVFPPLPVKRYGDAPFSPGATSNAPYAIVYTSSNPAIATVTAAGKIVILTPGVVTITASFKAGSSYAAPTPVSQVLTILKGNQVVVFPPIPNKTVGTTFRPEASSLTGRITFSSSNNNIAAGIPGAQVTCKRTGTVTITAYSQGNTYYNSATATQTLTVVAGSGRQAGDLIVSAANQQQVKENTLTISPNPVTNVANLVFVAEGSGRAVIIVTDVSGRVVLQEQAQVVEGANVVRLNSEAIKPGSYFINVLVDKKKHSVTMLKVE